MSTKRATKRALLTSILAICLCLVMLVGSTFAWFTDTASTGVNKIVSGNLHVEIQDAEGNSIENLEWKAADERAQDKILWEPGCKYTLTPFKIVNTGNLALKYKIVITGLDGDAELLKVIDFTYTTEDGTFDMGAEGHLAANGGETKMITVTAHMDEAAGNDYMDQKLEGVKFTVLATQYTEEYDSFNNTYDAQAEYPTITTGATLKDVFADANIDFGYGNTTADAVTLDGKGVATVEDWADAWVNSDTTIKGVTFKHGAAFNAQKEGVTITFEDCTFYACDQAILIQNNVDRKDNSGDGLCLNVETRGKSGVTFKIINCRFIGDGGEDVTRFSQILVNNDQKARGHAIGLNVSAGKCDDNPTMLIENCTIDNVRGNAIQLYGHTGTITIQDTTINSWGVNKEHKDYAIRGDYTTSDNKTITLNNVYFGLDENKVDGYEIGHIKVGDYSGNTSGSEKAGTYSK